MTIVLVVSHIVYTDPIDVKDSLISWQFQFYGLLVVLSYRIKAK